MKIHNVVEARWKPVQGLLDLSDVQLEDLMLLRHLFLTRRHMLKMKRLAQMASTDERTSHPIDNVSQTSDLASQLRDNAVEDHDALCIVTRALYCGVCISLL